MGYRKGGRDPDWWAESQDTLAPLIKQKALTRLAYEQAERSPAKPVTLERLKLVYRKANNAAKRGVELAREAWWIRMGEELTRAFQRHDTHVLYAFWKKLNIQPNVPRGPHAIRDKRGNLLTEPSQQLERWREHFEAVLNNQSTVQAEVIDGVKQRPVASWMANEPTAEELKIAIQKLSYNKTAGVDEIVAEMLKAGGDALEARLLHLVRLCWADERVPQEWIDALVKPIPKKGDKTDTDNSRGITLLSVAGKACTKIFEGRLTDFAEGQRADTLAAFRLAESQAAFRRNRGTTDMIFVARQVLEKAREQNTPLYACFFDLKKAYDTVNREALWALLLKYGVPPKFINMLKALYKDMKASVEVGGKRTEPFDVSNGLRQGCVISCVFFNLFFDEVVRDALHGYEGDVFVEWSEQRPLMGPQRRTRDTHTARIIDTRFADDLMSVARSEAKLQEFIYRFADACKRWGLTVSIKKTQVLHQPTPENMPQRCKKLRPSTYASIDGTPLDEVPTFPYLGSVMANDCSVTAEVRSRIAKASKCWGVLCGPVFKSKGLSMPAKLAVFKGAVLSSLLYGAETWAVKQEHVKMIESFTARCLRQVLKEPIRYRKPDFILFREANMLTIDLVMRTMRLRWFGHVARMADERMPKWFLYGQLAGTPGRKVGKPKQRWKDVIHRDLQAVGIEKGLKTLSWQATVQHRVAWRQTITTNVASNHEARHAAQEQARAVRKGYKDGRYQCPYSNCKFSHDQQRYLKSHITLKHTPAAEQRRQQRLETANVTSPAGIVCFQCPVSGCRKTLKRDTSTGNVVQEWKCFRMHLGRLHKLPREDQDQLIRQLGGVVRLARQKGLRGRNDL